MKATISWAKISARFAYSPGLVSAMSDRILEAAFGSLATVLWLIVLRREGEKITGWAFLKAGLAVMPPAMLLATLAVSLLSP